MSDDERAEEMRNPKKYQPATKADPNNPPGNSAGCIGNG
jgi:hypothetical protein